MKKDNKGFTLVELIIVIAIIAILGVVAAPQYISYVEESRVSTDENAINELVNTVKIARSELVLDGAASASDTCSFSVDASGVITATASDVVAAKAMELYGQYTFKSNTYKKAGTLSIDLTPETAGEKMWEFAAN